MTLVGEVLDTHYLGELMGKVELLIEKTIIWQVSSTGLEIDQETALLVWQKQDEQ